MGRNVNLYFDDKGYVECKEGVGELVVYEAYRSKLKDFPCDYDGVYLLLGEEENKVYVGRGNIADRLNRHDRYKEWWNTVLVISTKSRDLDATKLQYIESVLIRKSQEAGRYISDNGTNPSEGNIGREKDGVDTFIEKALFFVRALKYKVFEPLVEEKERQKGFFTVRGAEAKVKFTEDGYVLLKDSIIAKEEVPSCPDAAKRRRAEEKERGRIGGDLKISEDLLFASPSAVVDFVLGSSANGREYLIDAGGKSLKEIEESNS